MWQLQCWWAHWTSLLAKAAIMFLLPRSPAVQCRAVLAGPGKRTHLLLEIIWKQQQPRMSPVWRDSREAGLSARGRVFTRCNKEVSSFILYVRLYVCHRCIQTQCSVSCFCLLNPLTCSIFVVFPEPKNIIYFEVWVLTVRCTPQDRKTGNPLL